MLRNAFKAVVDTVKKLGDSYDKSINEFHRAVREMPPEVQISIYSSMHMRR